MYSVKLGFLEANNRINKLITDDYHSEALVTSMFTVEKTLRRTLRQIIVSAGFISSSADKLLKRLQGLDALKNNWDLYDPQNRKLVGGILQNNYWQEVHKGSLMRNKLVHGLKVYGGNVCRYQTHQVLEALNHIKSTFDSVYGYSGWERGKVRRKSRLHTDPKIHI
ncbi:hypothetical protein JYT29_00445 [Nitrospina gracilis]|nr:hypothetical protein [Nitrospina gracilis]